MNKSPETLLAEIPSYIATKLEAILTVWLKTEKEAKEEGNLKYDAKSRMRESLESGSVNRALQNTSNYRWLDEYMGVAGQGIFIDAEFSKKAEEIAKSAIKTWKETILA